MKEQGWWKTEAEERYGNANSEIRMVGRVFEGHFFKQNWLWDDFGANWRHSGTELEPRIK